MRIAVALAAIGLAASSVNAAPYYVGENLKPQNNVTLNFTNTMTKKDAAAGRGDTGNIAAIELRGAYNVTENVPVSLYFPFYMATKNATSTGSSRNAMGNIGLGLAWVNTIPTSDREMTWGYNVGLNAWAPTSRKIEGATVAGANPTTDLYRYRDKAFTGNPTVGLFVMADRFSGKANVGYGYTKLMRSGLTEKNLHTFNAQLGGSWHAMPNLSINAEYNTTYATKAYAGEAKFLHAMAPSVSGNYESFTGSVFGNIPLDSLTRGVQNVAFGLNVGYMF
jgi:hypothetical protein